MNPAAVGFVFGSAATFSTRINSRELCIFCVARFGTLKIEVKANLSKWIIISKHVMRTTTLISVFDYCVFPTRKFATSGNAPDVQTGSICFEYRSVYRLLPISNELSQFSPIQAGQSCGSKLTLKSSTTAFVCFFSIYYPLIVIISKLFSQTISKKVILSFTNIYS